MESYDVDPCPRCGNTRAYAIQLDGQTMMELWENDRNERRPWMPRFPLMIFAYCRTCGHDEPLGKVEVTNELE
jgi:hypothetical protein